MRNNRYPIEIELTDHCWLKCDCCVNYLLSKKWFMSFDRYKSILDYIYNNKDNILFVNICGIGDIFLHPEIELFLELFIKTFKGTGIKLLLPTKWQSIKERHVLLLQKLQNSWISLNISISLFSLNKIYYNTFTKSNTFDKVFTFIKFLKKYQVDFSIEFILSKNSIKELKYFYKLVTVLNIGYGLSNYHNFSGILEKKDNLYYDIPENIKDCSFEDETEYRLENFYCGFFPLFSQNWDIYTCSVSWKKKSFYVGDVDKIIIKYPHYLWLVNHIKNDILSPIKCSNCSIYKAYEKENTHWTHNI